jgi:hypothetical protein
MDEMVQRLAQARMDLAETQAGVEALREAIDETDEGVRLSEEEEKVKTLKANIGQLENNIKALAIIEFEASEGENKQPHDRVKIQLATILGYDANEVIEYCLANRNIMGKYVKLQLMVRSFEKAIRSGGLEPVRVDGSALVDRHEGVPKVTIATNLSDMLET